MKARMAVLRTQNRPAQPVECGLGGSPNNALALAMEVKEPAFLFILRRDTDPDSAHWFFLAAPGRSGDTGDAKAYACARALPDTQGHFHCGLLADRSVFL